MIIGFITSSGEPLLKMNDDQFWNRKEVAEGQLSRKNLKQDSSFINQL